MCQTWQKREDSETGNGNEVLFSDLYLFRQNDKSTGYENLHVQETQQEKQKHKRNKKRSRRRKNGNYTNLKFNLYENVINKNH